MCDEEAGKRELRRRIFEALGVDEHTGAPLPDREAMRAFGRHLAKKLLRNTEHPSDLVTITLHGDEKDPWARIVAEVRVDEEGFVHVHADVTLKLKEERTCV